MCVVASGKEDGPEKGGKKQLVFTGYPLKFLIIF